ncbi:MAG: glycerophosphodiester phosphodiesterase family protein [Saprospiraceae bacterium]
MQKLITLSLLCMFFTACSNSSNQDAGPSESFSWQGHRGCRGLLPENSIPAFLKALEYPEVNTLELDLAVSKDHQLIVSHEPWFNPDICLLPDSSRIAKKEAENYLIYKYTAEEIRAFDCGSLGNPRFPDQEKTSVYKPTLKELVEAVKSKYPEREINWNIEIKSKPEWDGTRTPPIDSFVRLVVESLKSLGIDQQANIQSFDERPLQIAREIAPEIRQALLIENIWGIDANLKTLGYTPEIYSPYYKVLTKSAIKKCHSKGMKVIPWTVNEVADMQKMIGMGVDGIITDYPNRIAEALAGMEAK